MYNEKFLRFLLLDIVEMTEATYSGWRLVPLISKTSNDVDPCINVKIWSMQC